MEYMKELLAKIDPYIKRIDQYLEEGKRLSEIVDIIHAETGIPEVVIVRIIAFTMYELVESLEFNYPDDENGEVTLKSDEDGWIDRLKVLLADLYGQKSDALTEISNLNERTDVLYIQDNVTSNYSVNGVSSSGSGIMVFTLHGILFVKYGMLKAFLGGIDTNKAWDAAYKLAMTLPYLQVGISLASLVTDIVGKKSKPVLFTEERIKELLECWKDSPGWYLPYADIEMLRVDHKRKGFFKAYDWSQKLDTVNGDTMSIWHLKETENFFEGFLNQFWPMNILQGQVFVPFTGDYEVKYYKVDLLKGKIN